MNAPALSHCACAGPGLASVPRASDLRRSPLGRTGQSAAGADPAGYTSNRSPQASAPLASLPASCLKYLKPGQPLRPIPQFSSAHVRSCRQASSPSSAVTPPTGSELAGAREEAKPLSLRALLQKPAQKLCAHARRETSTFGCAASHVTWRQPGALPY